MAGAIILGAAALTLLLTSAALARDAGLAPERFQPNVPTVISTAVLSDRYIHAPMIARGPTGRLHVLFGRTDAHYWEGRGAIGHAYSDDEGRSWVETKDAVKSDDPTVYDRNGAFGVSKTGKLICLFLRRIAQGKKPIPYQIESTDDGASWTAPHPAAIHDGASGPSKYSWPFPYGAIKSTPSGILGAMAYVGQDNSALVSRDDGATWVRNLIVWSDQPNYSEMGLGIIDEKNWIAVSRLDDQTDRMVQFLSRDAGTTWAQLGDVNLPADADIYVAPTIDDIRVGGARSLLLSYCDRRTKACEMRVGAPGAVVRDPQAWGKAVPFVRGFYGRSGYQSFVTSRDGKTLIGAMVRERSKSEADAAFFRIPVPAQ